MGIIDILASGNYITYNKVIAKKLGIDEAIVFGEMCSKQAIYGECFFIQMDRIMEDTCLTEYRVRNAIKSLKSCGIITVSKKGVPAKNYYSVCQDEVIDMLNLHQTSSIKFDRTGYDKFGSTSDVESDSAKEKTRIEDKNRIQTTSSAIVEKSNDTAESVIEASSFSDAVKASLREFAEYREERKQPLTAKAAEKAINVLRSFPDDETRIKSIDQSILNNWRGLFDVKGSFGSGSNDKRGMVQAHYEESYVPF
ncbi:hypothetical protein HOT76_gp39 [Eggerthella phage PMBT5]|uniref:Uncharacterized protein n=1 Tax=Eggerthella phage PMBT5 TaxID=2283015 RepID=A0A345MKF3_9CAUD|nr:hypothetical protein HOT76_gp39 [Eggerthella phage PMBT5]AXH71816.1 replication initiator protein [Eggerthella phage PMBT5]